MMARRMSMQVAVPSFAIFASGLKKTGNPKGFEMGEEEEDKLGEEEVSDGESNCIWGGCSFIDRSTRGVVPLGAGTTHTSLTRHVVASREKDHPPHSSLSSFRANGGFLVISYLPN